MLFCLDRCLLILHKIVSILKINFFLQACLGEMKKDKGNESVCLFVNVDGKKLVLGTLFSEKLPQQQFDLVFDKNFELSHNWKNGSVYFYGYKANNPYEEYPLSCGFPLKQYLHFRFCMLCIIVWIFSP